MKQETNMQEELIRNKSKKIKRNRFDMATKYMICQTIRELYAVTPTREYIYSNLVKHGYTMPDGSQLKLTWLTYVMRELKLEERDTQIEKQTSVSVSATIDLIRTVVQSNQADTKKVHLIEMILR